MKLWTSLTPATKIAIACALVACGYDFSERVLVSASGGERQPTTFDASQFQAPVIQQETTITDWLAAQTQVQPTEENTTTEQPKASLIEGGVNLGEMRVRVRGIYSPANNRPALGAEQIALLEAQHLTERSLELTEVSQGYVLENYEVTKINVDSVTFTGADGSTVVIPVFDY